MIITRDKMFELLEKARGKGQRIIAPSRRDKKSDSNQDEPVLYSEITSTGDIVLDEINTRLSINGYFLPRSEPILRFSINKDEVSMTPLLEQELKPTILFGVRPCDAASLPIMDKLYTWDYIDEHWMERRKKTTIISKAMPVTIVNRAPW